MSRLSKSGTTPEAIAAMLRQEITRGLMRPGLSLRQEDLAERFAVSRMPIRDALRLLEAEGLVVIAANRGAQVTQLTVAEVAEIFHLRILLECDCLEAACAAMDEATRDRIARSCLRAELDAGTPDWAAGDLAFHEALYEASGCPRQIALIRSLRATSDLYAAAHNALPAEREQWLADHRAIVQACQAERPAEAVQALRGHLEGAAAFVRQRMAHSGQGA